MDLPKREQAGLHTRSLVPLPLGAIQPRGWLCEQLRIQADGLSGHLDEFWPDVAQSRWIGGDAEGWERGPYWLDGVVPLAFLLEDPKLKAKVRHWVDEIVSHQAADGWLGPVLDAQYSYPYDAWPRFVVLKALIQYHEATGDERIPQVVERFLQKLTQLLPEHPLRSWAMYRWADLVLSIHWLYERTGEQWLLDLASMMQEQGFDWRGHFARFPYRDRSRREECDLRTHGVNNAMAIKAPGVWYRQSADAGDHDAVGQMIGMLDRYHGQATGMFTCDEHLAGRNPSQGSELCTVVEYMYSLETALPMVPQVELADRLERLAFNALPATLSPDIWSHQYDQQVNQVQCSMAPDHLYTSNGADANLFGLEPHFGCCTANMHQGWPKFASHLWMLSADGGLTAVSYAPCLVSTEIEGVAVGVEVQTDYPFDEALRFTIHAERPTSFPLHLRIPLWAEAATVQIGDEAPVTMMAGTFHREEREWQDGITLVLRLPQQVQVVRGFNNSVAISRGPLLFGLRIGEEWRQVGGELPHADWEVTPTTAWNYALQLDPDRPAESIRFESHAMGQQPFSPEGAPVSAKVLGRRVPTWTLDHGAAAPPPQSPVTSEEPLEELTLLPYGCTNLRIAEFPWLVSQT
ncbi:MAG: glycoside hydrolase family 127 protein [Herpetosiphonaceae bacterium]|nr:glycoside hydrolase family 127 protein [Herpetosiphonaceae bacterium]